MATRKRTPAEGSGGGEDAFMLLFVTLSLILLAFFILLNSMAVVDKNRQRAALGSLMGSFGLMPGSTGLDDKELARLGRSSAVASSGIMKIFEDLTNEVSSLSRATGEDLAVSVTLDAEQGVVHLLLSDGLLYPSGAAVLSPLVFPLMDSMARAATEHGAFVLVAGHTDDRPGKMSNRALSLERAAVVARHLEEAGALRGRVKVEGLSSHFPIADNSTAQGRATNRRVEVFIGENPEQL